MGADELRGLLPFILEEGVLAEFRVEAHLLVAGDAIHGAGMFVEDLVVAGPEFVRKIRARGNEAMELHGIADGPREQTGKKNGEGEQDRREAKSAAAELTESDPAREEGQEVAESRIREQGNSPKQSVECKIASARLVRDFQGAQRSSAAKRAESEGSQIHSKGIMIPLGKMAQSQQAVAA